MLSRLVNFFASFSGDVILEFIFFSFKINLFSLFFLQIEEFKSRILR